MYTTIQSHQVSRASNQVPQLSKLISRSRSRSKTPPLTYTEHSFGDSSIFKDGKVNKSGNFVKKVGTHTPRSGATNRRQKKMPLYQPNPHDTIKTLLNAPRYQSILNTKKADVRQQISPEEEVVGITDLCIQTTEGSIEKVDRKPHVFISFAGEDAQPYDGELRGSCDMRQAPAIASTNPVKDLNRLFPSKGHTARSSIQSIYETTKSTMIDELAQISEHAEMPAVPHPPPTSGESSNRKLFTTTTSLEVSF